MEIKIKITDSNDNFMIVMLFMFTIFMFLILIGLEIIPSYIFYLWSAGYVGAYGLSKLRISYKS